jgi:hypothetical protein
MKALQPTVLGNMDHNKHYLIEHPIEYFEKDIMTQE